MTNKALLTFDMERNFWWVIRGWIGSKSFASSRLQSSGRVGVHVPNVPEQTRSPLIIFVEFRHQQTIHTKIHRDQFRNQFLITVPSKKRRKMSNLPRASVPHAQQPSRLSNLPSQKARQLSHLHAQLAQLTAHVSDLENLLRMTAVQAESMRGLGGYAGAMFVASAKILGEETMSDGVGQQQGQGEGGK